MDITKLVMKWQNSPLVSDPLKDELCKMLGADRLDAFYKTIEFGTAGMRGLMGPGINRINTHTIRKATVAFGQYLIEKFSDARSMGVVIAHDNRYQSREFNDDISITLSKMGFNVYIFDELRPTPQLSYAVRKVRACGGIVITASHNPKQYNGFKVYDENGCQLTPNKIAPLIERIEALPDALDVTIPLHDSKGVITTLGEDNDRDYLQAIKNISLYPDLPKHDFKVVYSPQHGAGYRLGVRLLRECGYELYPVANQCYPDPDFPNTKSPNPELEEAYEEAIALAKKIKATLIVITDPDADRVGVAYRDKKGNYIRLTGNESGALLIDYLLRERSHLGLLADNGVVYDTIVTSPLGAKIAQYYHCRVETFLTGFKYIGDRIDFYERAGGPHFEFGYEESYGCLIAPFARDKDGLQALLMYAEMSLFYHLKKYDLGQMLHILQKRHGFHDDKQFSIEFKGIEGSKLMSQLLDKLRKTPFANIGSYRVIAFEDYLTRERKDEEGTYLIELPAADVVKFFLADGSSITVRPSGTEPKCKFYYSVVGTSKAIVSAKIPQLHQMFCATYGIEY